VEISRIEKNKEYKIEKRMSDEDRDKSSRLLSGVQELTLEFCCLTAFAHSQRAHCFAMCC